MILIGQKSKLHELAVIKKRMSGVIILYLFL